MKSNTNHLATWTPDQIATAYAIAVGLKQECDPSLLTVDINFNGDYFVHGDLLADPYVPVDCVDLLNVVTDCMSRIADLASYPLGDDHLRKYITHLADLGTAKRKEFPLVLTSMSH